VPRSPRLLLTAAFPLFSLLLFTGVTLLVAAALKSGCLSDWRPGFQPKFCYNDIQTLWYERDMSAHVAPYQGELLHLVDLAGNQVIRLGAGQIEYPVLTGVFAWLTALPVQDATGYWIVTAAALTPFALLAVIPLYRVAGRRAWLYALSPQLAAYAYLNWDFLPVTATAAALWSWTRQRYLTTGVLLAVGACAKIYPGFLLLPFLITLLLQRQVRSAVRLVGACVVTALVLNVPFMITNLEGWYGPYAMQAQRFNDRTTNSLWYWIFTPYQYTAANLAAWAAVGALWAVLIGIGLFRHRQEGTFPALAVAGAMIAGYIAVGRVDSPQYGLWLVPFLVVLSVRWWWVLLFTVTDLWLWGAWSWLWGSPLWVGDAAMAARGLSVLALAFVMVLSHPADGAAQSGAPATDLRPDRARHPDPLEATG